MQSCGLHRVWLERDSPITHITFNPKNPSHILLHDIYMFCVLDKSLVSPWAGAGGLGLCPGHLPCVATPGAEGGECGGPGSADVRRALSSQPLPDNSALLMNQGTLKQLPETARKRQLHAFKICKKFQVGDGVAGCVLGGCPVAPSAVPVRRRQSRARSRSLS